MKPEAHPSKQEEPVRVRVGSNAFFPPLDLSAVSREQWCVAQKADPYCSIVMAKLGKATIAVTAPMRDSG